MTAMRISTARGRMRRALALLAVAATVVAPRAAEARRTHATPRADGSRDVAAAARPLDRVATAYEDSRTLDRATRLAALDSLEPAVTAVLHGDVDASARSAAQFLLGTIRLDRGDGGGAVEAFRKAGDAGDRFDDDAAFAAIRALEASGRDADAAREWIAWQKRWPASPLQPEAELARAWNALRRGDQKEANERLARIAAAWPWMTRDSRVTLARATAAMLAGRPNDAVTLLGPKPAGAAATYLYGAAQGAAGSLLRSAAAFQEVADRWPDSPLRDAALLAKANAFLAARDVRSAAQEFARAAARITDPSLRAEAELRAAGCVQLGGATDSSLALLRDLVSRTAGTDVAARAQFLIGEALAAQRRPADAIVEYNRVLTDYFKHDVASSAQYRVARCLDALGRRADATGSYEAVVRGYPLSPEAPAAAYLAGVGMLAQQRPLAAAPYFQLVIDRYASARDAKGLVVFASPEHQELVEAALCLLELSYHRTGNLGQLSGAPHLVLRAMPPSRSLWHAYALLVDADASASQARYPEAQATLEGLVHDFPDPPIGSSANQLLAWTYAQQGRDSLAIATEERLLARYGVSDPAVASASMLDIAHERFNQKRFRDAAAAYEEFVHRWPTHPQRLLARYQAGLCYLRLDRAGDAVDRWEAIVRDSAAAPIAERAWARAGDLYFQADRYTDAERCYQGLLEHFAGSAAAGLALLRLGQCEYNAGRDAAAIERFTRVIDEHAGSPMAREAQRGTELALYRMSQTPQGQQQLAKLVEQFPGSAFAADAEFKLAQRSYAQSRWSEAAEGCRHVVSQFPGYSGADQAQFLMADALARAKRPDDARLAYEQFVQFFPNSELRATARFRVALMDFDAKDYARAAVAFTQVLDESTSVEAASAAQYNLALCQRMLGQADDARATLEAYRQKHPRDARAADVACQLGDLAETAGRADDAAHEYEAGLALPGTPKLTTELAFRLGRVREQLGAKDAALAAYRRAAVTGSRDDAYRLSAVARCAALYEARHETARAVESYRDLIRNANDRELVAAATTRVAQLQGAPRTKQPTPARRSSGVALSEGAP